ncbi:hypothetical protein ABZY09_22675 [Streptomyces sp. NPDC002928]|uniref:hypothetical protein n=1 Tax=Streptomyces sp. NPDC002928 TaxID=3154440 RepID=UPI00339F0A95
MRKWRGSTRELAALMGALAVALALMVWGASSASAGGPTSVLVTSPESGEATALYYSDKEYDELQQLLGPTNSGTRNEPPEADLTRARQINVTWLAHDIAPWRVDQVFPVDSKPQAAWIHTAANVPESPNGYWHRADHPTRLRALLTKLGVMSKATGEGYTGIFPAPWQSEPSAAATPDTETATLRTGTPAADDNGTEWWWALPGAAAGAALTLLLRPLAARLPLDRLRREPGPRQELRDV